MSRNSLLVRVRQVASPHKMARARLERVQKINKVSKSLFGPVIKSEFQRSVSQLDKCASNFFLVTNDFAIFHLSMSHANRIFISLRYAQIEMTKYQLQAANKWNFDFVNETPIRSAQSQYAWDAVKLTETPKFYHHEFIAQSSPHHQDSENIRPLAASPALIIHNSMVSHHHRRIAHPVFTPASSPSTSFVVASSTSSMSNVCNKSQRKITGKRRKNENNFPFRSSQRRKTLKVNRSQAVPRRQLILIKY